MYGVGPISMNAWLGGTEWNDRRRFEMTKSMVSNEKVLDFGFGARLSTIGSRLS